MIKRSYINSILFKKLHSRFEKYSLIWDFIWVGKICPLYEKIITLETMEQ